MSETVTFKCHVDADLLDQVEVECETILWQQRQRYNQRWYQSLHFTRVTSILRLVGLVVSSLGIGLSLYYLLFPTFCPRWFYAGYFLVFFIVAGLVFLVLPKLQERVVQRMLEAGRNGCRKMARRLVSRARKLMPYESEYTLRGDLISCFREKDGRTKQVWNGRIRGYAVVGQHVTLVFRKSTSIIPKTLILCNAPDALGKTLMDLGVEGVSFDEAR